MAIITLLPRRGRRGLRVTKLYSDDEKSLATIAEEENEHSSSEIITNDDWLPRCVELLSSSDDNENIDGLGKLLEAIRVSEQAALHLIYGTNSEGSSLRNAFLAYLCETDEIDISEFDESSSTIESDADTDEDDSDDSSCDYSSDDCYDDDDDDSFEDDEDGHPQGKNDGRHHGVALQILCAAFDCALQTDSVELQSIDFLEPFWIDITTTLVNNIETNFDPEITKLSLSSFRLLHSLEPRYVEAFLNHVLRPYLFYLKDLRKYPLVQSEASRLYAKAENTLDHHTSNLIVI